MESIKLTNDEVKWFKGLQKYANSAPASLKSKFENRQVSSYTIGDSDITFYDVGLTSKYAEENTTCNNEPDLIVSVQETDAELFIVAFPFYVDGVLG